MEETDGRKRIFCVLRVDTVSSRERRNDGWNDGWNDGMMERWERLDERASEDDGVRLRSLSFGFGTPVFGEATRDLFVRLRYGCDG